jgi:peptide deformylase
MILKVARLGYPVLRSAAIPVAVEQIPTPEFQKLLDDMVETMYEYSGVGLAGPQVHLGVQVAVLEMKSHPRHPELEPVPLTYLINPELTVLDGATTDDWEGCLSIPELRGNVPRYQSVRVRALGRSAEALDFVASGYHARIIQHECDHLRGDVYLDRMADLRTLAFLDEWQRFSLAPEKK